VQHERELWQSRMLLSPPLEIGGEGRGEVVSPASGPSPAGAANEMRGNAASRGVVRARARLIESPEDGRRLGPGEVLVSVLTSPAWTSLFAVAGAVVTEGGGILSHAAIVAREYGIPCVVGVRNATGIIEDGQIVTVDGTKGEVRLGD
jgi:phosphoenolpyruvate synthase/pyruvate phosphate dikinase